MRLENLHLVSPTFEAWIWSLLVLQPLHRHLKHLRLLRPRQLPTLLPPPLPRLRCLSDARIRLVVLVEGVRSELRVRPRGPWQVPGYVRCSVRIVRWSNHPHQDPKPVEQ